MPVSQVALARAAWRCPKPTLVVELLQAGQVAQHGHAVAVRVGPAAGVLCQPQHPQPRQRLQVEQLVQARDVVLPQVQLAQVLALVQRLEVRDAVHAVETRSEPVPPSLPHPGGSTALPSPLSCNSLTPALSCPRCPIQEGAQHFPVPFPCSSLTPARHSKGRSAHGLWHFVFCQQREELKESSLHPAEDDKEPLLPPKPASFSVAAPHNHPRRSHIRFPS